MEFLNENLRNNLRKRNFSPDSNNEGNLISFSGSEESLFLNPIDENQPRVEPTARQPVPPEIPTSTPKFSQDDLEKIIEKVTQNIAQTVITTSKENIPSSGYTLTEPTILESAGRQMLGKKDISELGMKLLANASKYDGSDKKPLQDFILEYNQLIPLLLNKNEPGKLTTSQGLYLGRLLKLLLKGEALRYIEGLPDRNSLTHKEIFSKLGDRFRSPRNSLFYQEKLRNLCQNNMSVAVLSEKLLKYAKNYVETSSDARGEEKEKLVLNTASHYILGALKPAIFEKIIEREVGSDYQKIVEEAKKIEQILSTIEIRNGTKVRKVAALGPNIPRENKPQIMAEKNKNHVVEKFNGEKIADVENRKQGGRGIDINKYNERNHFFNNRSDDRVMQGRPQNQLGFNDHNTPRIAVKNNPFQPRGYSANNAAKIGNESNATSSRQQNFSMNWQYPGYGRNHVPYQQGDSFFRPRQQNAFANQPNINRRPEFQDIRSNWQGGRQMWQNSQNIRSNWQGGRQTWPNFQNIRSNWQGGRQIVRPEQAMRGFSHQNFFRTSQPQYFNNFQDGRENQGAYRNYYTPFALRNQNNQQRPNVGPEK